jgi:Zn2+/Cd2+-exporting ATPase
MTPAGKGRTAGPDAGGATVQRQLRVGGMDCPSCAGRIKGQVCALPGVRAAEVNFAAGRVAVTYDPDATSLGAVAEAIERLGHPVQHEDARGEHAPGKDDAHEHARGGAGTRWTLVAIAGLAAVAAFVLEKLAAPAPLWQALYGISILLGGLPIARAAFLALRSRHTTDINFLMTIAAVGAVALGDWAEAATILLLFSIASALESHSMERTRRAIRELMRLAPEKARLRGEIGTPTAGEERVVPVSDVAVGDVLVIRPGDRIPLDGEVVAGGSAVNQAAITGESVPVEKGLGDEVYAGTFNEHGSLEVRVTRPPSETMLSRIVQLVEEAQGKRSSTEQFIDRFARYYTPLVLGIAALLATAPTLLFHAPFGEWFYRSLTLLIIACPCALVISTPVAIVCALARAARSGALIKGGVYLERAGSLKVLAFDKTGTLTHGRPRVTDVIALNGLPPGEIVRLAAGVERRSEHALAHAILEHARHEGLDVPTPAQFEAMPGRGARAVVDGRPLMIGKPELFAKAEAAPLGERTRALQAEGKTVVYLGTESEVYGILSVADTSRDVARKAVTALRELGIERIEMLTGDNAATAAAVARDLGIGDYRAELMPADKVARVQALMQEGGAVGMVGDGINDAPALAAASVGIAMGAAGTDVALETADIALMGDDLSRLPYVIALSRRTLQVIRQNIAFSLVVKVGFIALTLAGFASLWLAVLADTGCSLLVVGNSLRLLRFRAKE